jgi:hypothetical protein
VKGLVNSIPQLVPAPTPTDRDRSRTSRARGRIRSWHAKAAAFRAALLVFALTSALIGAVAYTLDRNAQRSSMQQSITELASGSRVAASTFSALRANLRAHAGQIAASLDLQRAVIVGDRSALRRIALADNARIVVGGHTFGALAPLPRIASTAIIAGNARILARVTLTLPLGNELLKLIRDETPLPAEAALVLAQNGRVIAGGPHHAAARVRNARVVFGSIDFAAQAAPVGLPETEVIAVEPVRAVQAGSLPYRRQLLLAALVTLVLAAGLATRLGRPVARLLNHVSVRTFRPGGRTRGTEQGRLLPPFQSHGSLQSRSKRRGRLGPRRSRRTLRRGD